MRRIASGEDRRRVVLDAGVEPVEEPGWSASGTPSTRQIACDGSSRANARTKSTGPSPAASRRAPPRRRSSSVRAATARGVKPRLTSVRRRWCCGSSVWLSMMPAVRSSLIAVPPLLGCHRGRTRTSPGRAAPCSRRRGGSRPRSPRRRASVPSARATRRGRGRATSAKRSWGKPPRNVSSSDRSIALAPAASALMTAAGRGSAPAA